MTSIATNVSSLVEFENTLQMAYPVIVGRLTSRYRDPQLAEEVAWDSLTRAFELWREDPHYFDERNLIEWSSHLAGWRALDHLRKRSRHTIMGTDLYDDDQGRGYRFPGKEFGDESREQDCQLVWESLQRLDASERDLLCASYYDNRGDQEIGVGQYADGTVSARGLRVWRRRQKAQAHLRCLLLHAGLSGQAL